jgi:hypothetical protein
MSAAVINLWTAAPSRNGRDVPSVVKPAENIGIPSVHVALVEPTHLSSESRADAATGGVA